MGWSRAGVRECQAHRQLCRARPHDHSHDVCMSAEAQDTLQKEDCKHRKCGFPRWTQSPSALTTETRGQRGRPGRSLQGSVQGADKVSVGRAHVEVVGMRDVVTTGEVEGTNQERC